MSAGCLQVSAGFRGPWPSTHPVTVPGSWTRCVLLTHPMSSSEASCALLENLTGALWGPFGGFVGAL
eukprot:5869379-Pyramimonas_sp.AAC.1